jgi:TolB-like protein/Flp pilus assembly protein TadD
MNTPPAPSLLDRVRGRRLVQWTLGYVAGGWILLELTDFLAEMFGWPEAWVRGLLVLLSFGLLATLVLAWYHGDPGRQRVERREAVILTLLALVGGAWAVQVVAAGDAEGDSALGSGIGLTRAALAEARIPDPREASHALAVLPFVALGGAEEGVAGGAALSNEAFADGVMEDILHQVSLIPGLRVISRTSTMRYRDSGLGILDIGRELAVDLVLEGSVRRAGDRARIVVQLVDARMDEHLWSGSYDRELSDLLGVQAEVAAEVARALATTLGLDQAEGGQRDTRVARGPPVNPEAYAAFVEGRTLVRSDDPAEVERGGDLLVRAVELDPRIEPAFRAMAFFLERTAGMQEAGAAPGASAPGVRPAEGEAAGAQLPRIRTFVREALESPAAPPEVTRSHAWRVALDRGDFEAAERALTDALVRNPNDAEARRWYGVVLSRTGRHEAALEQLRIAEAVDPASSRVAMAQGSVFEALGRAEEALDAYRRAWSFAPSDVPSRAEHALVLAVTGDPDGARERAGALVEASGRDPLALGVWGYLNARSGAMDEARTVAGELSALPSRRPGVATALALVHAGLADTAQAAHWAERARAEAGWGGLTPGVERALSRVGISGVRTPPPPGR